MKTVFIGGSRAVSRLNNVIREQLDNLLRHHCKIIMGDANGADKAVQTYLASQAYAAVEVFCMEACRNNVGGWQVQSVSGGIGARKDFGYYATKDLAMSKQADCGFMLWDGKSRGTLNNILNLLESSKKVLVYFAPRKSVHKLEDPAQLRDLLQLCNGHEVDRLLKSLGASHLSVLQMRL